MKVSVVLALLSAASTALARSGIVFGEDMRGGNVSTAPAPEPTIHSRFFKTRLVEQHNWRVSQWFRGNQDLTYNTPRGKIFHSNTMGLSDVHTIATVEIPAGATGKTCQVILETNAFATVDPPTSGFYVYLLNSPHPSADGAWNAPLYRISGPMGPLQAVRGGDSIGAAVNFPCTPYAGTVVGLEFAPNVGSGGTLAVNIEWDDAATGPYLLIV